jgi:transposase-like protein
MATERKTRHNYPPEEKVFILKRHLAEKVPVSDLCDEYKLQPKIFGSLWVSRWCHCCPSKSGTQRYYTFGQALPQA